MNAREQGLLQKFHVSRVDGRDAPGAKHAGAEYFVLDLSDDPHAWPAIAAYTESCAADYPALALDLRARLSAHLAARSEFVTIPETTLPGGRVVPAFQVARYPSSRGPADVPLSTSDGAPWVEINYQEARDAAEHAGLALITESQWLAIALDIAAQDINWTDDKVGAGALFQGLHKNSVTEAQPGNYAPRLAIERTWHQLSTGERIYHFAGNAFSWVFDDVQGDEAGLSGLIKTDSPSLTAAPFPSCEKGMGWRPDGERDWPGHALFRGGCWCSGSDAGVFRLNLGWPGNRRDFVGFRCTQPIGR